eukprot:COSAG01_NODE_72750_length_252_cov_0.673203_1_plen_61_part_10
MYFSDVLVRMGSIAYGKPPDCNHDGGCDPLYKHEWASIITQIRNHPCVFDYTMVRSLDLPG